MKIRLKGNKKILFSIVGLPRSGTTIVNNIFNSFDNGFSISEPHWAYMRFRNRLKFGKIRKNMHKIWDNKIENIIPSLNEILQKERFIIGGFKETYSSKGNRIKYITDDLINLVIFVFRNPVYMINSQVKEGAKNIDMLIGEYNDFSKYFNKIHINNFESVLFNYDEFIESNHLAFLNYNFRNYFTIEGEFKIKRTRYILGDNKAHNSIAIQKPKNQTKFLDKEQIEKIKNNITFNLW